jgi:hypothetical protein
VCDLETSRIGAPYIYIYDIKNLRVKYIVCIHTYRQQNRKIKKNAMQQFMM